MKNPPYIVPATTAQAATTVDIANNPEPINWELAYQRRELMEATGNTTIKYFFKPEIQMILDAAKDKRSKHFLINTLWHTGARVSEALALTKGDFIYHKTGCFVKLTTLKQKKNGKESRLVPLADKTYIDESRMFLGDMPKAAKTPVWTITRATLNIYLANLAKELELKKIHPHMFRHSFAINAMLCFTPLPVLQGWLGHTSITSTAVYTEIYDPDTMTFMTRIGF